MLDLLSDSQNLELTGAPPPAAGPCPKFPKIDQFFDLKKMWKKLRKLPQREASGHPKISKNLKHRKKFQLVYPFGWSWEKALPPELPRRPKGRKQGTRSLIRSRRRGQKHSLHFPTKHDNVFENDSQFIQFGPHIATLGATMRPNVSLGAFQRESETSSFCCYPLGSETNSKSHSKID